MKDEFGKYYEAREPGRRERAYAWATAIGLQDVDGLKPSKYLIETAKRNIEGEITAAEARKLVDEYYEVKGEHDVPEDAEEADKVAARINQIINTPSFTLSPEYYIGLHGKIFEGVFAHAGKIRDVDLTKREWVLNGDSVQYGASFLIVSNLEGEFVREVRFKYKGLGEDAFIERFAMFISNLWQIHPFREGNTRTIVMLITLFAEHYGYYFDQELMSASAGYVRNSFVLASQGEYSEYEHLEKILCDAISDEPIEYTGGADTNAEKSEKYGNGDYVPTKHEYIE